jgi:hypothetical protein
MPQFIDTKSGKAVGPRGLSHFLAEPFPRGLNPDLVAAKKNRSMLRARLLAAAT